MVTELAQFPEQRRKVALQFLVVTKETPVQATEIAVDPAEGNMQVHAEVGELTEDTAVKAPRGAQFASEIGRRVGVGEIVERRSDGR
ncbi:hypothetical protein [Streptosporangium sp. NPDC006930]|uniref:hypothetical protein n=1 Tax=unclassified Streptosporangium TaxID=2632669 RepID=UPI003447701A